MDESGDIAHSHVHSLATWMRATSQVVAGTWIGIGTGTGTGIEVMIAAAVIVHRPPVVVTTPHSSAAAPCLQWPTRAQNAQAAATPPGGRAHWSRPALAPPSLLVPRPLCRTAKKPVLGLGQREPRLLRLLLRLPWLTDWLAPATRGVDEESCARDDESAFLPFFSICSVMRQR